VDEQVKAFSDELNEAEAKIVYAAAQELLLLIVQAQFQLTYRQFERVFRFLLHRRLHDALSRFEFSASNQCL
jgi:hypothetical protein